MIDSIYFIVYHVIFCQAYTFEMQNFNFQFYVAIEDNYPSKFPKRTIDPLDSHSHPHVHKTSTKNPCIKNTPEHIAILHWFYIMHRGAFCQFIYITAIVVNLPEKKLAKRTSVQWGAGNV